MWCICLLLRCLRTCRMSSPHLVSPSVTVEASVVADCRSCGFEGSERRNQSAVFDRRLLAHRCAEWTISSMTAHIVRTAGSLPFSAICCMPAHRHILETQKGFPLIRQSQKDSMLGTGLLQINLWQRWHTCLCLRFVKAAEAAIFTFSHSGDHFHKAPFWVADVGGRNGLKDKFKDILDILCSVALEVSCLSLPLCPPAVLPQA